MLNTLAQVLTQLSMHTRTDYLGNTAIDCNIAIEQNQKDDAIVNRMIEVIRQNEFLFFCSRSYPVYQREREQEFKNLLRQAAIRRQG